MQKNTSLKCTRHHGFYQIRCPVMSHIIYTFTILGLLLSCKGSIEKPHPSPIRNSNLPSSLSSTPTTAPIKSIAITIDDLPWVGDTPKGETPFTMTKKLIKILQTYQIPTTGFVICQKAKTLKDPIIEAWHQAGMTLGNHTEHHKDLNKIGFAHWKKEVKTCDTYIKSITQRPVRFFRYPFLHEGNTQDKKSKTSLWLQNAGYQNAHVSIDTSDWLLAHFYSQALRQNDQEKQTKIERAWQKHIINAVHHYQTIAQKKTGREIHQILLLHANALLMSQIETLLLRLQEEGFQFISLEEALSDPIYQQKNIYLGSSGISWLYRITPASDPEDTTWDLQEEKSIRHRFTQ